MQVAFDVEDAVLEAVRHAAFAHNLSQSDQIRHLLGLPTAARPKRPRLTVSLSADDYVLLAARYGVAVDERLLIKEKVTAELIAFAGLDGGNGGDNDPIEGDAQDPTPTNTLHQR